jgi:hypothetical protein
MIPTLNPALLNGSPPMRSLILQRTYSQILLSITTSRTHHLRTPRSRHNPIRMTMTSYSLLPPLPLNHFPFRYLIVSQAFPVNCAIFKHLTILIPHNTGNQNTSRKPPFTPFLNHLRNAFVSRTTRLPIWLLFMMAPLTLKPIGSLSNVRMPQTGG